jgi:hypothetical protein
MNELWEALAPQLVPLVVSLVGIVSTWAINSLRKRLDSQRALTILNLVERMVEIGVSEAEQVVVPEAKKAMVDGKLTREEGDKIKALVIERAKAHLPSDVSESLIASAVEAAVLRMKVGID